MLVQPLAATVLIPLFVGFGCVSTKGGCVRCSMAAATTKFYTLRPLSKCFGMEVVGVDMSVVDLSDSNFVEQLKSDLVEHRALLFRRQELSGQRQVEISNTLGRVESTFYKHPRSPHPDVFRVSNMENEGCTNVGRSGYHVDGTFVMTPFMYQTMYFPAVAEGGDTNFIPLRELYDSASPETRARWDRLWMVTSRRDAPVHPLVYQHPFRNDPTMIFHCGEPFVEGWLEEDVSDPAKRHMLPPRPQQEELTDLIEAKIDELGLRMKWEKGDFMISDNLGLAHFACEGTQKDWKKVGLRILHRTTVVGGQETIPRKVDGRTSFTM